MNMTFKEFFDMSSKVLTDPPKGGVQGISIKKNPVASPEKRGKPIVTKKAKGDVPIKGGPKLTDGVKGKIFEAEFGSGEADMTRNATPLEDTDDANLDMPSDSDQADTPEFDTDDIEGIDQEDGSSDDKEPTIRKVAGAHLVHKKPTEDGAFEELWIFPMNGTVKDEVSLRRAILAGTDIKPGKMESDDGSQSYTLWTAGNAQIMHITGLQN